jgi:hypothetical protein
LLSESYSQHEGQIKGSFLPAISDKLLFSEPRPYWPMLAWPNCRPTGNRYQSNSRPAFADCNRTKDGIARRSPQDNDHRATQGRAGGSPRRRPGGQALRPSYKAVSDYKACCLITRWYEKTSLRRRREGLSGLVSKGSRPVPRFGPGPRGPSAPGPHPDPQGPDAGCGYGGPLTDSLLPECLLIQVPANVGKPKTYQGACRPNLENKNAR